MERDDRPVRELVFGDRQVVPALEALAGLVEVQLRAVLRVAAVKEVKDPLRLLGDVFCAARGAWCTCLAAGRFDGRMHTQKNSHALFFLS